MTDTLTQQGMKICTKCELLRPYEDFGKLTIGVNGLAWECTPCRQEYHKGYYQKNRQTLCRKSTENRRKRQFGVGPEQYQEMLEKQGFACAICLRVPQAGDKALAVDHDHKGGQVRGLLCMKCNQSIGRFEDDPETLIRAAGYLLGKGFKK